MRRDVAVVGTDTGVGKTLITKGLLWSLSRRGHRVAPYKPVETGLSDSNPKSTAHASSDAAQLAQVVDFPVVSVLGRAYALPAAPLASARAEGQTVDIQQLRERYLDLAEGHDLVLVEGAGGLMVPYAENVLFRDLLSDWNLSCLVVGRLGLGTLNHTLLTLEALRNRHLPVLGVVLSATEPPGPEADQTPFLLKEFCDVSVFGVLPWGCVDPPAVAEQLSRWPLVAQLEQVISQYRID